MRIRHATQEDIPLLARLNHQLQEDEQAPTLMTMSELTVRLRGWMKDDYKALFFEVAEEPVAYALYRAREDEMYVRQFHVIRSHRRRGIGRQAIVLFRDQIVAEQQILSLEAYVHNDRAIAFWHALGFRRHTISFRIEPRGTTKAWRQKASDDLDTPPER